MIIDFNKQNGGGGSGSGVTPEQVQAQIDSALTYYWDSANTEDAISAATSGKADAANVSGRSTGYYFPYYNEQGVITGDTQAYKETLTIHLSDGSMSSANLFKDNSYGIPGIYVASKPGTAGQIAKSDGYGFTWADDIYTPTSGFSTINGSAITNGGNIEIQGGADAKILVDFDKTPQSERAALYAELKALYDGGSGSSINKLYDFYKTVNTWQGQKIDYYTFSGNTLVFGQVVSPENVTDQVVYVQVMEIDSAGNVNVVTNAIGASGGGVTQEYVDSAVTILQNQLDTIDDVIPAAIVDLNERVDEISASTPSIDLSGYYTSAQTEEAISAATAGKADAANVQTYGDYRYFPKWNEQGIITDKIGSYVFEVQFPINDEAIVATVLRAGWDRPLPHIYAPTTSGNPGEILVSTGNGAPVWSAVTMGGVSQEYVDSAITQVQDQLDIIDQVASAALVDLNEKKVESEDVKHMVKLTQAQYDAIITKDPNTFYIIVNN